AAKVENDGVQISPLSETKRARAMWGTYRALVAKLVTGVTKGYEKKLDITGVGYRAAVQGKNLNLQLGYAHEINFAIPDGVTIVSASSIEKDMRGSHKTGANIAAAKAVGKLVAERAAAKGVKDVVFDRGGYLYHGRVKALAEAAREGGLKF